MREGPPEHQVPTGEQATSGAWATRVWMVWKAQSDGRGGKGGWAGQASKGPRDSKGPRVKTACLARWGLLVGEAGAAGHFHTPFVYACTHACTHWLYFIPQTSVERNWFSMIP